MGAILAWFMNSWLGKLLLNFVWGKLVDLATKAVSWAINWWKQKNIAKKNLEKDKEAMASGDLDAISKAGESLLNGDDAS